MIIYKNCEKTKQMICPECKKPATFTAKWSRTVNMYAPIVMNDNQAEIDYDAEESGDSCSDECETVTCNECESEVDINAIEEVESVTK